MNDMARFLGLADRMIRVLADEAVDEADGCVALGCAYALWLARDPDNDRDDLAYAMKLCAEGAPRVFDFLRHAAGTQARRTLANANRGSARK
jgi:hypothetical protein